jgi:hypothetical protein
MFVEHKEQGEVQEAPAKVLKLSEAVRQFGYVDGLQARGCVLACAYRGVVGRDLADDCGPSRGRNRAFIGKAAETFNVPYAVADKTETLCMDMVSPNRIASWLEGQGY